MTMRTNGSKHARLLISRFSWRALTATSLAGGIVLTAGSAIAGTTGISKPQPNVMILLDTSGSMETMIDGTLPEANATSTCVPGTASYPNRWGIAMQALTGAVQPAYSCWAMDRGKGTVFDDTYGIKAGGTYYSPYDSQYYMKFHRPVSGTGTAACAIGPGTLPGAVAPDGVGIPAVAGDPNAEAYSASTIQSYLVNGPSNSLYALGATASLPALTACNFAQSKDGLLDQGLDLVRFGLMTFDNDPSNGVGVSNPSSTSPSMITTMSPFAGQWSYWYGETNGNGTQLSGNWTQWTTSSLNTPVTNPEPNGKGCGEGLLPGTPTCSQYMEVGAKNAAAPPWEGRLVGFADGNAPLSGIEATNAEIQNIITALRPYGATPIAGMLDDARGYFWNDTAGPESTTNPDPYVAGGCRGQYIILLTDGAPNQDLRGSGPGYCNGAGGTCPYQTPTTIAAALSAATGSPHHPVYTFVIGFAVTGSTSTGGFPPASSGGPYTDCNDFQSRNNGADIAAYCGSSPPSAIPVGSTADACCTLHNIAVAGTPPTQTTKNNAFFVDSPGDLQKAFAAILATVSVGSVSKTSPAYSPTTFGSSSLTASYLSEFNPNPASVWTGDIERERIVCPSNGGAAQPQTTIDKNQGDDFALNLASTDTARNVILIEPTGAPNNVGTLVDSTSTIRPYVRSSPADAIGTYGAKQYVFTANSTMYSSSIGPTITPDALAITNSSCPKTGTGTPTNPGNPALSAQDCEREAVGFALGATAPAGISNATFNFTSRASAPFGAIYHSTPIIVPPPSGILSDDSYQAYATLYQNRPSVLYVETTDGLLHAFDANPLPPTGSTSGALGQNELWSFIPPLAMPSLLGNYPGGQQAILDAPPVVREVVWDRSSTQISATSTNIWHTMLVSGFGSNGTGYFAMDVTDPCVTTTNNNDIHCGSAPSANYINSIVGGTTQTAPAPAGPHFMWQLSDFLMPSGWMNTTHFPTRAPDQDGNSYIHVFGQHSGTPAITTLFFDPDGTGAREIGVAILPGGQDGSASHGFCHRYKGGSAAGSSAFTTDASDTNYPPRPDIRQWSSSTTAPCYSTAADQSGYVPGRVVAVVRIDTGEIIRLFIRPEDSPPRMSAVVTGTPLDSPMIGVPVVYPSDAGAIGQKAYVGDADGTVWRFDLSSQDPTKWYGELFHDAYNTNPNIDPKNPIVGGALNNADDGQVISLPPVLSLDSNGNVVLAIATGDQDTFASYTYTSGEPQTTAYQIPLTNYLYSVSDATPCTSGASRKCATVNYYQQFTCGERVTGPMTVFNSVLYYATYAPTPAGVGGSCTGATTSSVCSSGEAKIYGRDYIVKYGTHAGAAVTNEGGDVTTFNSTTQSNYKSGTNNDYVDGGASVLNGVGITATQTCAAFGSTTIPDPAIPGGTIAVPSAVTASTFSFFAGAIQQNSSGAPSAGASGTISQPQVIGFFDSWAPVAE